jgi:hypothetical protein
MAAVSPGIKTLVIRDVLSLRFAPSVSGLVAEAVYRQLGGLKNFSPAEPHAFEAEVHGDYVR